MDEFKANIPEQEEWAPAAESYAPPVPKFKYAPRQREIDFAQLIAVGGDPIQALAKSGILPAADMRKMKRSSVYQMAARLLNSEAIQERLDYFRQLHACSMNITAERILQEWAALAFTDIAQLYDDDGEPISNPHLLPRHVRAAIKEMYTDRNGVVRVKLKDSMKALDNLADYNNMLNEAHEAKAANVTINLDSGGDSFTPQKNAGIDNELATQIPPPESSPDDLPECLR